MGTQMFDSNSDHKSMVRPRESLATRVRSPLAIRRQHVFLLISVIAHAVSRLMTVGAALVMSMPLMVVHCSLDEQSQSFFCLTVERMIY